MIGRTKTVLASTIGTALEFYDFMLYAVFLEVIGDTFFPTHGDHFLSIAFGWMGFIAAFIMRPFGATVFGYIGDHYGRRIALILSVTLMGIPTFIIGVLPGYEAWGIAAPTILILCRLLQGLCTGGEYNGSAIFALEHAGKHNPGLTGGLITGASIIGALAANMVGLYLKQPGMPDWGWRAAFGMGAVISLVGLYIRLYTSESPEFEKLSKSKKVDKSPLMTAIRNHWQSSLTTVIIGTMNGLLSYTLLKFLDIYLNAYFNVSKTATIQFTNIGLIIYVFAAPALGFVLDKLGGAQYMKRACLFIFIASAPLFYLIQMPGSFTTVIAELILGLCVASIAGPQHAFVQTLFPAKDRYSGVAFNFCIGMAIGGGVLPMVMLYIVEKTRFMYAPTVTIMIVSSICFYAIHKIQHKRLEIMAEDEALNTES